uniref:VQ domain-containing protein n=1 Tax=Setaria digitata TaxID=48799 RepID=A0A915PTJ1_9BILA
MSKSSTVPETMHTSLTSTYDLRLRANTRDFQRHLHELIRSQSAITDDNGNTPLLSVASTDKEQFASVDSLPSTEPHSLSTCGMTCSSASDSGCMLESDSSTATIDDDHKVLINMDESSANNNNNNNNNNSNNNNNNNNSSYNNSLKKPLPEYAKTDNLQCELEVSK